MIKVNFNDFQSEPVKLKKHMLLSIESVIDSGSFILGDQVSKFEEKWAKFCDVKNAIGVGNCFDALVLGMQAMGIGHGDEVITTPETAFATSLAIMKLDATPVLCDIELSTGHMCIESAQKCVTARTKAVLFVHLYGQAGDISKWQDFCSSYKIDFIEDCAQAHGAKFNNKPVGTFGTFGAWSFYPTKNLGCLGDGGALTTNNDEIATKVGMLRNYGQSKRYYHDVIGNNSRLDEIQAAILNVRIDSLEEFNLRRKEIASMYNENISSDFIEKLSIPRDSNSHIYHLYVVRSKKRKEMMEYLASKNIETLIHYPVLVNEQKAAKGKVRVPEELISAKYHASTCFSLPCHPQMTNQQVIHVIETINKFE